jgi:4a-hydroxytetrahydrobiopterin dehydratase
MATGVCHRRGCAYSLSVMANSTLTTEEITEALKGLPGWKHENDALVKAFEFGSFREAMSFMVRVAFEVESMNHHPEWTNVYDTLNVRLTTHHVDNKVTTKDVELAQRFEKVSWL